MKTVNELREQIKRELFSCHHVNDNTLAAQVNENVQWAWDNWDIDLSSYYEGLEKPECYTKEFMEQWIDNEDFETELQAINE